MPVSEAIERIAYNVALDEQAAVWEKTRPSYLYRPTLSIDGNQWCALYGEDLQHGVAGFGRSPCEAYAAFDRAWIESLSLTDGGDHA